MRRAWFSVSRLNRFATQTIGTVSAAQIEYSMKASEISAEEISGRSGSPRIEKAARCGERREEGPEHQDRQAPRQGEV